MPKVKLTDAAIKRFQAPKDQRVDYFDATLPGFALRVSGPTKRSPEGRKSWVLFYRFRGEQKRLTFEPEYPHLSLAAARKRAGDAIASLSEGKDPAAEKAAARQRNADTIDAVVEQFIFRGQRDKGWAPRYVQETQRNFKNHVAPRWSGRDIKEITRRDINDLLDAVADSGTTVTNDDGTKRHVPGGQIAANRVLAGVRALFSWALARGIVESTPAAKIEKRGDEESRDRALTDQEIQKLWSQFDALGYPFSHFLAMVLATGQRRDEVARMRDDEIDDETRLWTIPKARTKAGREHVVPLSGVAWDFLQNARAARTALAKARCDVTGVKQNPGPFVFTTTFEAPISGFSKAKKRLEERLERTERKLRQLPESDDDLRKVLNLKASTNLPQYFADWRIHDLRRTVATGMAKFGTDRFIISRVLNHSDRSVTAIYDRHSYLDEKRRALDTWANHLRALVDRTAAPIADLAEEKAKRKSRTPT